MELICTIDLCKIPALLLMSVEHLCDLRIDWIGHFRVHYRLLVLSLPDVRIFSYPLCWPSSLCHRGIFCGPTSVVNNRTLLIKRFPHLSELMIHSIWLLDARLDVALGIDSLIWSFLILLADLRSMEISCSCSCKHRRLFACIVLALLRLHLASRNNLLDRSTCCKRRLLKHLVHDVVSHSRPVTLLKVFLLAQLLNLLLWHILLGSVCLSQVLILTELSDELLNLGTFTAKLFCGNRLRRCILLRARSIRPHMFLACAPWLDLLHTNVLCVAISRVRVKRRYDLRLGLRLNLLVLIWADLNALFAFIHRLSWLVQHLMLLLLGDDCSLAPRSEAMRLVTRLIDWRHKLVLSCCNRGSDLTWIVKLNLVLVKDLDILPIALECRRFQCLFFTFNAWFSDLFTWRHLLGNADTNCLRRIILTIFPTWRQTCCLLNFKPWVRLFRVSVDMRASLKSPAFNACRSTLSTFHACPVSDILDTFTVSV